MFKKSKNLKSFLCTIYENKAKYCTHKEFRLITNRNLPNEHLEFF